MIIPADRPRTASPIELTLRPEQRSRLRPLADRPEGSLAIHEIYRSIQGESLYAGLPCVFVRLTACHLRCVYCDTPHAFNQGEFRAREEIMAGVLALGDHLVEITGGEPLLQPEVFGLMEQLADHGRKVLLETAGSIDLTPVDARVHIIMDVKTPGSGEVASNSDANLDRLKPTDELKYVICDRADFDWSVAHVRSHGLVERLSVVFSPAFGQVNPTDLAAWILETRLPLRLQLQLHKQLWDPNRRGV